MTATEVLRSHTVVVHDGKCEIDWKRVPLNAAIRKHIAGKYRRWRSEGIEGRIYAKMHYLMAKKWERHTLYGEPWDVNPQ